MGSWGEEGPKRTPERQRVLSTIKLDEFSGGQGVSAHQYRTWKKSVKITQELNGLTDNELALLIYSQVKGKATIPPVLLMGYICIHKYIWECLVCLLAKTNLNTKV